VMFTGLYTGDTGVGVMDVAPMGMAMVAIFELLELGRGGLRNARSGKIATNTIEVYITALIVSVTATVAFVESTSTATDVVAMTNAKWLSFLALALMLSMTATARTMILVMLLLWVLEHAGRELIANDIVEHVNLPLNCIDGSVVVAKASLCGDVSHTKVGNSDGQEGREATDALSSTAFMP
jgi:hypothetical protein